MGRKHPRRGTKSLKWFLIQRFLLVMLFIFVSEELLNMIYRIKIGPFLEETMNITQLSVVTGDGSMLLLMLQMFLVTAAALLPGNIAGRMQTFISENMGNILQVHFNITAPVYITSPALEGVTDKKLIGIYQIGILFIFFGLFIITLLPYLLSAYWYYKAVTGKVNELLQEEKEQKEAYDRQRNLLLSDIAHDIKTPLTTVCGYARALVDNVVEKEEKKKEYLHAIYAKSMRMDELITLLFEYVKLDSDGFTLHREDADLGEVLRENAALLYADFEENGIELEIGIPEHPFPCKIDKTQFGRALTNIMTNSVKYNEKGTTVSLTLRENYEIRIADDGAPIDKELAEHIFEPFSRGDRARSTRGGSGLGLSISSRIIQMHGGELRLENECRDGKTKAFVILLTDNNNEKNKGEKQL